MKFVVYLCLAFGAVTSLAAQETLTLSQCLQMAVDNNLSLQKSRNEMAKGKITISENQAKLLPQINAVAQVNDNFAPPVSVTDGTAYGKQYNVTKTLQYNAAIGPISNAINLLENNGVKVIEVEEDPELFDGTSSMVDGIPVVVLNANVGDTSNPKHHNTYERRKPYPS